MSSVIIYVKAYESSMNSLELNEPIPSCVPCDAACPGNNNIDNNNSNNNNNDISNRDMTNFLSSINKSLSKLEEGVKNEMVEIKNVFPRMSEFNKRIESLEEEVEKRRVSLNQAHAALLLKQEQFDRCGRQDDSKKRARKWKGRICWNG